jgi:hypothetical protein
MLMSDVNEIWSSPWRTLQKNLASGFATGGMESGRNLRICDSPHPGRSQVPERAANSWLVRARSRELRLAGIIQ